MLRYVQTQNPKNGFKKFKEHFLREEKMMKLTF